MRSIAGCIAFIVAFGIAAPSYGEHQVVTFDDQPIPSQDKPVLVKVGPAKINGGEIADLFYGLAPVGSPWSTHCYYNHNIDRYVQIIPGLTYTSQLRIDFTRRASNIEFDLGNFIPSNLALGPFFSGNSPIRYNTVRFDIIDDHGNVMTKNVTGYDPFHLPTPGQTQRVFFPFDNVRTLTITPRGVDTPLIWNYAIDNLEFDARDNERFSITFQGETTPITALVAQDLTAEIPLGARFDMSFERRAANGSWSAITSGVEVTSETVKPALPATLNDARNSDRVFNIPLFPETVLFPYDAEVAADKKTFQVVHKGDATVSIKPDDAQHGDDPIELKVSVVNPDSLGVKNAPITGHAGAVNSGAALAVDEFVVKRAHISGIPPQYLKAQIDQETGDSVASLFSPYALRYEPYTRDYAVVQQNGFLQRRISLATETFGQFALPNGSLLCRTGVGSCPSDMRDLDDFEPPHRHGYLYCNNGHSVVVPSNGVYPTARQYVSSNVYTPPHREWPLSDDPSPQPDCADKIVLRPPTTPTGRSRAVRHAGDLMAFTAQPTLASSFGWLQIIHADVLDAPFYWSGYNGRKNPSLLFDTAENLARADAADTAGNVRAGGSSLKFGVMRDVRLFHVVENGVPDDPIVFKTPAQFREQFRLSLDLYNGGGTGYGQQVMDRVASYLPQKTNPKVFVSSICTPPAILNQTTNVVVEAGTRATLSVNVDSPVPTVYDWFLDTAAGSQRISGAEGSIVVDAAGTATYHATATSTCGTATSQPMTVSTKPRCSPVLNSDPAISNVSATAATLTASASGSGLSFSWFIDPQEKAAGVFVSPPSVGSGATITVSRTATPVLYRVLVSNSCGFVTSGAVIVPALSSCPAIASQPSPVHSNVVANTAIDITVVAAGSALSYQWYAGNPGETSQPVAGATTATLHLIAHESAAYWVRITNTCGSIDSAAADVTVAVSCVPPSIASQTQLAPIAAGDTATLSVTSNGTAPFTYAWYEGAVNDVSRPVANPDGNRITVTPSQSTSYWVRVGNGCGSANSIAIPVTVLPACVPPAVAGGPTAQAVVAGHEAVLTVVTSGTSLSYQWYAGASGIQTQPVFGATDRILRITPSTTTSYWLRITNGCGAVSSPAALVTVVNSCTPPVAAGPSPMSILIGETATLSVWADGTPPFSYQWYIGSAPDLSHPIDGATDSVLPVSPSVTTLYWVRITNACGVANSSSASVLVSATCRKPVIVTDVVPSTSVLEGQPVELQINAGGDAPSYQWYSGVAPDTSAPLFGETANHLAFTASASGSYWVRVTNACGVADSSTAAVSVTPCAPVEIEREPVSITIPAGVQEFVAVGARGTEPIEVQWYIGSSGDRSQPVPGGTGASLSVSPSETTMYWADLRNPCGSVESSAATVVVLPACTPPFIEHDADSTAITDGGSATLTVVAKGDEPLSYQWFVGEAGDDTSPIGGATSASVTVAPHVTTSYWVEITNACGFTASAATITVNPATCVPPSIAAQPEDASITAGTTVRLSVSAQGTAPLAYQWYVGIAPDTSHAIDGATGSAVDIAPASTTTYWVRITNACGSHDSVPATVTVTAACMPPAVDAPASLQINAGETATLVAAPNGSAPFSFQWYLGSSPDQSQPLAGATSDSISVSPAATTSYWVRVTNACGAANSGSATVTVIVPCDAPTVSVQPQSQSLVQGGTATLSVVAGGVAPFTYQWYVGQSGDPTHPIAGETSSSFTVQPDVTTDYWVRITNACGGVNSDTATITVREPCIGCGPGGGPPPQDAPVLIPAPQHFTATAQKKGVVDLSWRRPAAASGTVTYQVWRSDGAPFKPVATPKGESYRDAGLTKGRSYRYFVIAIDKNGSASAPSNIATVIAR